MYFKSELKVRFTKSSTLFHSLDYFFLTLSLGEKVIFACLNVIYMDVFLCNFNL